MLIGYSKPLRSLVDNLFQLIFFGNIFISPTSLFMALSMVYNGADGVTIDEMAKVLQVKDIEADELNRANASLMYLFHSSSERIQLHIANSI